MRLIRAKVRVCGRRKRGEAGEMGPDFFLLLTGRKTLFCSYLQVGQLRGCLWSQSQVVAELDGDQGHKPRWSINQDRKVEGKRDCHCFCISMFFWAAFLPSLLDLLGLETFPRFLLTYTFSL